MTIQYYNCEFLSDIVLPASSNTQGNVTLSDFIGGSNFLGMVATSYDDFKSEAFEVFHSGAVCFGDGHIAIEGKPTYKIPLSFHNLKVGEGYFNRLHLSDDEEKSFREEQKQLKQLRSGFMTAEGSYITAEYDYTQKSSYDAGLRRSKDEGMYGYSALKKGSNWIFKVSFKNEAHILRVEKLLLGDKKLGKSKSSQYGKVHISKVKIAEHLSTFTPENGLTYVYVNSRLALYDENGCFTAIPTIENLGLKSGQIVWDKTFIKTSSYHPHNYKRQSKEYTRVCINKGSVITLTNCTDTIQEKVGAFQSEGFGEVIINPSFLKSKLPTLLKYDESQIPRQSKGYDENIIAFLQAKEENENAKFAVSSHVQQVFKDFTGPSKSQWGQIRAFASVAKDKEDLTRKIDEYISHGVSKKQWENKDRKLLSEIEKSKNPLEFTKLLAMTVSKHTKGGKDGE